MRSCSEPPTIGLSRSSSLVFVLGRISPRIRFSSAMYASSDGGCRKRGASAPPITQLHPGAQQFGDAPRVVRLEDFTEDEMALIARAEARPEDAHLDAELKDWKP